MAKPRPPSRVGMPDCQTGPLLRLGRFNGCRVGILGGSFNPAHDGHRALSLWAIKRLRLDYVWWLISPQNPLKSGKNTAPLAHRMATAQNVQAEHPKLHVTALETALGSTYTAQSMARLRFHCPRIHFVWLMGADNLRQIPHWRNWRRLFHTLPIAVFHRHPDSLSSLTGQAAMRFRRNQYAPNRLFPYRPPPAWCFSVMPGHPASSTALRARARTRRAQQSFR